MESNVKFHQGKIFNDPIYGLIRFPHEVLYRIIDHPYFQRLRRISQQALSHYVYPGAMHTRFQHALGALHLMTRAIDTLRAKGVSISESESEAVSIAILLHDIGHGPYSHALENELVFLHHEVISKVLMQKMGDDLQYDFELAIKIFEGKYHRPFLHNLVSGSVDMDRMDYLTRDSYFSGVAEGIIGYDRIIAMMNVKDDDLVIEEKGMYSVEKFLMARRLMYHQVYLHKTVVAVELMLRSIIKRLKYLIQNRLYKTDIDDVNVLLNISSKGLQENFLVNHFVSLDDTDIMQVIKKGQHSKDMILSKLCKNLLERELFKLSLSSDSNNVLIQYKNEFSKKHNLLAEDLEYFFPIKSETKQGHHSLNDGIKILTKQGSTFLLSEFFSERVFQGREEMFYRYYSQ
ncbi:MAG: HD domain-containing protein [Saprospiraceae bacterium]